MKDSDSASGKDFDDSKIYCANCIHCKVIKTQTQNEGEYQLRVRCDAGMWKKKMGDEKYYKYFTVIRPMRRLRIDGRRRRISERFKEETAGQ